MKKLIAILLAILLLLCGCKNEADPAAKPEAGSLPKAKLKRQKKPLETSLKAVPTNIYAISA